METLELYVVRSKDGKYFRSKGYGGYGESWVDELKKAKIYTKRGPALSQITFWTNAYPSYGIPDLIPLTATPGEPIDQTERVKKSQKQKHINEAKQKLWRAEYEYDRAKRELERAKGSNPLKVALEKAEQEMETQKLAIQKLQSK